MVPEIRILLLLDERALFMILMIYYTFSLTYTFRYMHAYVGRNIRVFLLCT